MGRKQYEKNNCFLFNKDRKYGDVYVMMMMVMAMVMTSDGVCQIQQAPPTPHTHIDIKMHTVVID